MFDPNTYREACARLTPGAEKLEEMIAMTENTNRKKHFPAPSNRAHRRRLCGRPVRHRHGRPAVQKLFMSFSVTFTDQNGNIQDAQMFICPDLALEKRDGKDILTVDGKEIDVTDAFAKDGKYVLEEDGATVTVTREQDHMKILANEEIRVTSRDIVEYTKADETSFAQIAIQHPFQISLTVDGEREEFDIMEGDTVADMLAANDVELRSADKITHPRAHGADAGGRYLHCPGGFPPGGKRGGHPPRDGGKADQRHPQRHHPHPPVRGGRAEKGDLGGGAGGRRGGRDRNPRRAALRVRRVSGNLLLPVPEGGAGKWLNRKRRQRRAP